MCTTMDAVNKTTSSHCSKLFKGDDSLKGVDFRYVPTEDNPADMATTGKTPLELSSTIWWNGPHWLNQPKDKWPKWKLPETKLDVKTKNPDKVFYEAKLVTGRPVGSKFRLVRPL